MKKIYTLLIFFAITASAFSQVPEKMSYQAVIRDASNTLVKNHPIGMRISILQGSTNGTVVYTETQTTNTNANGLVSIEIGGETGFDAINWSSGSYFIKTETDPTGGTNYSITGISQILSVPYALHAENATNYKEIDPDFGASPSKGITSSNIIDWNTAYGWGNHTGLYKSFAYVPTWVEITGKPSFSAVAVSGSYSDLLNKPILFDGTWVSLSGKPTFATVATSGQFSDLVTKPTTLAGYFITDAMSTSHPANGISSTDITNWTSAYGWGNHAGLYKASSYTPGWAEITGKPVFSAVASSGLFSDLLSRPTTLAGYGITNAMSTSHPANTITSSNISNWTVAYSWGNHNGLYRPVSWVPSWDEITDRPTTVAGYGITDAVATSGDQTISGNKTFTGTINASNNNLTNLANPINNLDAATKEYVDNVFKALGLVEDSFAGVVTDIDGNVYKTVKIGDQIWMVENLRTSRFNDGSPILNITNDTEWINLYEETELGINITAAYCWYNNDSLTYEKDYGKLYNFGAAYSEKLCPVGWHVPSFLELSELFDPYKTLTGPLAAFGEELMEEGDKHWIEPAGTNETGFTGLPGGMRSSSGTFSGIGTIGDLWSSTPWASLDNPDAIGMAHYYPLPCSIYIMTRMSSSTVLGNGFSIRCLKD